MRGRGAGRALPLLLLPIMIMAFTAYGDGKSGVDADGFCDQNYLSRAFDISSAAQAILPYYKKNNTLSTFGKKHLDGLRAAAQAMQRACNAFSNSFGSTSCQIRAEGKTIGIMNPDVFIKTCEKIIPVANGAESAARLRSELVLMSETMIVDPSTPIPTDKNVELLTPNVTLVGIDAQ